MTNLEIYQRIIPRKDGKLSLQYFDGSTMLSYRFPSKASEKVFCLRESKSQMCEEGRQFSEQPQNLPISILKVDSNSGKSHIAFADVFSDSSEDVEKQNHGQYLSSLFKSVDFSDTHRENVIKKYFSGQNTYNPFADRQEYLYSSSIPRRKLS